MVLKQIAIPKDGRKVIKESFFQGIIVSTDFRNTIKRVKLSKAKLVRDHRQEAEEE